MLLQILELAQPPRNPLSPYSIFRIWQTNIRRCHLLSKHYLNNVDILCPPEQVLLHDAVMIGPTAIIDIGLLNLLECVCIVQDVVGGSTTSHVPPLRMVDSGQEFQVGWIWIAHKDYIMQSTYELSLWEYNKFNDEETHSRRL